MIALISAAPVEAVPDARLTVQDVTMTPEEPIPHEPVIFEITIANSAGSSTAVEIQEVTIGRGRNTDSASDIGSLSVGDSMTVPLSLSFGNSGAKDIEIEIEARDVNRDRVELTYPYTVVIEDSTSDSQGVPYEEDIALSTSVVPRSILQEEPQQQQIALPQGQSDQISQFLNQQQGTEQESDSPEDVDESTWTQSEFPVEVAITNLGTGTLRNAVLSTFIDGEQGPRLMVEDVPPRSTQRVYLDTAGIEEEVELEFRLGFKSRSGGGSVSTNFTYYPRYGEIKVTDVDMRRDGDNVIIRGTTSNVGLTDARGVLVSVLGTEEVTPSYPQRNFFVGTVSASDFGTFEVSVEANENISSVPLEVSYSTETRDYSRVYEFDYDPRELDNGGSSGGLPWMYIAVAVLVVALIGAAAWRYRG